MRGLRSYREIYRTMITAAPQPHAWPDLEESRS